MRCNRCVVGTYEKSSTWKCTFLSLSLSLYVTHLPYGGKYKFKYNFKIKHKHKHNSNSKYSHPSIYIQASESKRRKRSEANYLRTR